MEDHVLKLRGKRNAAEARYVLTEFGNTIKPASPRHVTYSMIERYAAHLREHGNKPATVAKKLRYVRAGLNAAVKRRYAAVSEFDGGFVPGCRETATTHRL